MSNEFYYARYMQQKKGWVRGALTAGAALAFVGFVALWGIRTVESMKCEATANQMRLGWYYSGLTGCMIEVNGKPLPLDAYKFVNLQ